MGIINFLASAKKKFAEGNRDRRLAQLEALKKERKIAYENATITKAIDKQKAEIKALRGRSTLSELSAYVRKNQERNTSMEAQPTDELHGRIYGGGFVTGRELGKAERNIHENNGRNIWGDQPHINMWETQKNFTKKRTIWD